MIRTSIVSFNVWGKDLWPDRRLALSSVVARLCPDILLLQEVSPDIITCLNECLPEHDHVIDDTGNAGWSTESQIYWNRTVYRLIDEGYVSYGHEDYPNRGLFWTRLQSISQPHMTIFASTVHLPWVGCKREIETGVNQRIVTMTQVVDSLRGLLVPTDLASFIGGDLNEEFHPIRMLNAAGFHDVFQLFDVPPPVTHPVRPSAPPEEHCPSRTLDWILCAMPPSCRVISATAKQVRAGLPPPSDHLPVVAIIELSSE